ncbi:arginase family protein [Phyllobacterium sp. SB3]|uniref:arginase family protein n=1 Tax=Phyllobacterium sp. SB3 TaxID=3156073 RepID=UPI0032AF102F
MSTPMKEILACQGRVADRTPNAVRGAFLTAQVLSDRYDLTIKKVGMEFASACDDWTVSLPQAHVTLAAMQYETEKNLVSGNVQFTAANTCSASLASLPLVAKYHPDAKVLWIDAHGDFNTPAITESGYLGGMVLAAATGYWDSGYGSGLKARNIIIAGARDIDPQELALLERADVAILSPKDATPEAIRNAIGDTPVWIHIDWDCLEPGIVPAAYKVQNGLAQHQIRLILQSIKPEQILGVELAEFEAADNAEECDTALSNILDIVEPLFDGLVSRRQP